MNKKHIISFILIIAAASRPLSADVSDFKKIIEDYLSVSTIKASITQYIYPEDGSAEVFSGNYFAASKGLIRIDYIRPENQTIVINDSGLYWYYSERRLLFFSQRNSGNGGTIPVMMNLIPEDNIKNLEVISEGKKFYSLFKTADIYSVISKKNKTRLVIWVDPLLKIIKRKYILDESGREMIKEDYTDHAEINGIFIPSRIELKARTASGVVQTVTEYKDIVINSEINKELFKFRITPEMKVRTLNAR